MALFWIRLFDTLLFAAIGIAILSILITIGILIIGIVKRIKYKKILNRIDIDYPRYGFIKK